MKRTFLRDERACKHGPTLLAGYQHVHLHPTEAARGSSSPLPEATGGEAGLSVITYGELIYGAEKSAKREAALERLRELITLLPALPMPETAAETHGSIRATLEAKGEMIGNNDLWIAAHALASNLTLVTNNEREFRRVPGLKVQNWAV